MLHNNDLNQVTWELRAMGGAPKFERVAGAARRLLRRLRPAVGLAGITVASPTSSAPPGSAALAADRPTVLDVHCDPDVPPIPPHATLDEAVSMVESVLGGDPSAVHMVVQGAKEKLQELLPGRNG